MFRIKPVEWLLCEVRAWFERRQRGHHHYTMFHVLFGVSSPTLLPTNYTEAALRFGWTRVTKLSGKYDISHDIIDDLLSCRPGGLPACLSFFHPMFTAINGTLNTPRLFSSSPDSSPVSRYSALSSNFATDAGDTARSSCDSSSGLFRETGRSVLQEKKLRP